MENYEQKYKEAFERAKDMLQYKEIRKEDVEYIFSELKESKDERIRKEIVHLVETRIENMEMRHSLLAWLEKQKPTEKVEPKFKVGDYVVNKWGKVNQVIEVAADGDGFALDDNSYFSGSWADDYRLWTIQDAKNGDVLHCWIDGDEYILIYKGIKDGYITTYGHLYHKFNSFAEEPTSMFCRDYEGDFTPATKEQRDLLFSKMKEAGYEWDAERQEPKKIKQKHVEGNKGNNGEISTNAEWSEEDETIKEDIILNLQENYRNHYINERTCLDEVNWLKSLRSKHWEPTEEQMGALEHFVRTVGESGFASPYDNNTKLLYSLLNDLKKL